MIKTCILKKLIDLRSFEKTNPYTIQDGHETRSDISLRFNNKNKFPD